MYILYNSAKNYENIYQNMIHSFENYVLLIPYYTRLRGKVNRFLLPKPKKAVIMVAEVT